MNGTIYISAILPLKLEWEPCYSTEAKVSIGDRIKVAFANKVYRAVVSGVNITPDINPDKIRPVLSVETDIERILPSEIAFWRQVAEYCKKQEICSCGLAEEQHCGQSTAFYSTDGCPVADIFQYRLSRPA